MGKIRVNFGVSEAMREWIVAQPGVVAIVESSDTHIIVEHTFTEPQLTTALNVFKNKLIESI